MFICPNCQSRLARAQNEVGFYWACPHCGGRAVSVPLLRRVLARDYVNRLWGGVREGCGTRRRRCPACERPMLEVEVPTASESLRLDVCKTCEFVWFDRREFESTPAAPPPPQDPHAADERKLPQAARERLAIYEARLLAEEAREREESPDAVWKTVPAIFGLPVEWESQPPQRVPWLTFSVAALIALVGLTTWGNLPSAIQELGLVPAHPWRAGGATFVTSFFLHGGFWHLVSNLYFLVVFGERVEEVLGWERFLVLLALAALGGDVVHVLGDPHSDVPLIGASGGISGIIACYALKFPHARLGFFYWAFSWYGYFRWVRLPAWFVFALWILVQLLGALKQLSGFGHVSALAHLGGAAVGLAACWLWRRAETA